MENSKKIILKTSKNHKNTIKYISDVLIEIKNNPNHNYSDEEVQKVLETEETAKKFMSKVSSSIKTISEVFDKAYKEIKKQVANFKFGSFSDEHLKKMMLSYAEDEDYENAALAKIELNERLINK